MSAWETEGMSDEWYTPKYIFDALDTHFDMDVAAPYEGPRYVPCKTFYSSLSFSRPWIGYVWMNPPFGKRNGIVPWMERFIEHGNGIALVPDRTSAPWFQQFAKQADAILFISPKVKFERPDGSIGESPGCGTALIGIGERSTEDLSKARKLGFLAKTINHKRKHYTHG